MPTRAINDPNRWRECAEQMRALVPFAPNREAKRMMLRIAYDYDQLAATTAAPKAAAKQPAAWLASD